jgi:hypothetical protein
MKSLEEPPRVAARSGIIPHAHLLATAGMAAGVALLAFACDVPTKAPIWTNTWIVPISADSVTVGEILPNQVTLNGTVFKVTLTGDSVTRTLGSWCPACTNGTVPKPAFIGIDSVTLSFPVNLFTVTLAPGNTVPLKLVNGFDFDPIRPSGPSGPTGRLITVFVAAGNDTIGADTVDGATTSFPARDSLSRTVALASGVGFTGPVRAITTLTSPADATPVTINTARTFKMVVPNRQVDVAGATIGVQNDSVVSGTGRLDLSLEPEVSNRLDSATVEIVTGNPFDISGALSVHFERVGSPVITSRSIVVGVGTDTSRFTIARAEIRSLLNTPVDVSLGGRVSATLGPVTILPTQLVSIKSRIFLHITLGD